MKIFAFTVIFACLGVIYCSGEKSIGQTQDRMKLIVEPGDHWLSKMKVLFVISINKNPQLTAWIEDNNGNYVSTIAVSEKSAKGNWRFAPSEGRPEALPVWNHKQHNFSVTYDLDAISSATTKGSFEAGIDKKPLIDGNTYNVYLEINHSFDYNDHWTKKNSGVNGQPSMVYHAQFVSGHPGRISLVPTGHGSIAGSDGNVVRDLESMTTALNIIKNAYIVVK